MGAINEAQCFITTMGISLDLYITNITKFLYNTKYFVMICIFKENR